MGRFYLEAQARSEQKSETLLFNIDAYSLNEAKEKLEEWLLNNADALELFGSKYSIHYTKKHRRSTSDVHFLARHIWSY